ncbi:hypothetical protein IGI04_041083, partial [Brassica rapa subsp. trilocularis]
RCGHRSAFGACDGADEKTRRRLHQFLKKLKLKAASEYNYLNQSNCLTIDRIDDSQKFHKLMVEMALISRTCISTACSCIMVGNVSFEVIDNENHVDVVADEAVTNVAMLMGCD